MELRIWDRPKSTQVDARRCKSTQVESKSKIDVDLGVRFGQDLSLVEARYFYYELLGPKDCQSWLPCEGNFEGIIWAMENMLRQRSKHEILFRKRY